MNEQIFVAGMLTSRLAKYRTRPRVYVGCMKSGPVLSQK
jgi:mitotic spindle assembly checkpoint protein MAD1